MFTGGGCSCRKIFTQGKITLKLVAMKNAESFAGNSLVETDNPQMVKKTKSRQCCRRSEKKLNELVARDDAKGNA